MKRQTINTTIAILYITGIFTSIYLLSTSTKPLVLTASFIYLCIVLIRILIGFYHRYSKTKTDIKDMETYRSLRKKQLPKGVAAHKIGSVTIEAQGLEMAKRFYDTLSIEQKASNTHYLYKGVKAGTTLKKV